MFKRNINKYLQIWKDKYNRKPLILRGARQVGKTSTLKQFGIKEFDSTIYINMESPAHARIFNQALSVQEFISLASSFFKVDIEPKKTLIILDEIQESEEMIKMLRFFYEDMPELHVVCAGSLLEVKIAQNHIPIPVGRVEFAYIYPLTFFEYLVATNNKNLLTEIKNCSFHNPPNEALHQLAMHEFNRYCMIGGMPEAVNLFLKKNDLEETRILLNNIMTTYSEDSYKYTTTENYKYVQHIIQNGAIYSGKSYNYENFANSNYRSKDMNLAFQLLEKAMILKEIFATNSLDIPIIGKHNRPKKLLWLDIGFVNVLADIYQEYFIKKSEVNDIFRGQIAEQIVGQTLLTRKLTTQTDLYYWAREKSEGDAEIDFCFMEKGKIVGIEVKSGSTGKLKSLQVFKERVKNSIAIRIYSGNLEQDNNGITSLPFYLLERIEDFYVN